MNDNLGRLLESSSKILLKAKEWKATGGFKHKNPCQDWKRNKHCIHYAKARYRQFKSEIDPVLKDMGI